MLIAILTLASVILDFSEGLLPLHSRNIKLRIKDKKCPSECPKQVSPVCGTDGKSYDNVCKMLQVTCQRGSGSPEVGLLHVGRCGVPEPCPVFCPTHDELQFCGDDGVTYPSMCHVIAATCRSSISGPTYVSEGPCKLFRDSENFLEDLSYIPDLFRYNGKYGFS